MLRTGRGDPDERDDAAASVDNQKNAEDVEDVDDNQAVLSRVELARTIRKSILSQVIFIS